MTGSSVWRRALMAGVATAVGAAIGRALTGYSWFGWVAWAFLAGVVGAGVLVTFRVRREGAYMDWMTSAHPQRLIRLFPLLGLPISVTLLPLTLVSGALICGFALPDWPHW